ncbi:coiled-coil domain-containing protein 47, partial [Elysia marginata]
VPLHLRTSWDSFYLEMLMIAGLTVYFLNFLAGKNKNCKLATAWLSAHKELLETQFSIVGDDGVAKEVTSGVLMKESENVYTLWCSGRTCVEGMLVELKLLKRQDLINLLLRIFKPASDQVIVKYLGMVQIVKYLGMVQIRKYLGMVQIVMHLGMEQIVRDTQPTKMPETKACLMFCFTIPGKGKTRASDMENLKPLLQLVFYCVDKVSRLQLSREARMKAEKNRQKAEEMFLKAAHTQRQELAQQRREERKRAEKERLMAEEDPDRARKLEDRENRRESKRKQPKMKMMKIKAM